MKSAHIRPLIFLALAFGGWQAPAGAEGLRIEPNIAATLLWTNYGNLGFSVNKQDDFVADVKPWLHISAGGPQLRIKGDIGLTSTTYANGTQPNRTAPLADLALNSILVERLFFLDAGVRSAQSNQNLFGVVGESSNTANSYTSTQIKLSPYIERELTPKLKVNVRSDNTWTKNSNTTVEIVGGYYGKHAMSLALVPEPLGGVIEAQHSVSAYHGDHLSIDLARMTITAALGAQVQVSSLFGAERTDFGAANSTESGAIYGARLAWHPSERTHLQATVEHRFFGPSWDATFTHRSPYAAWNLSANRQISSFTERIFNAPAGSNIDSLLNAAFTTRYPDPLAREQAVRDFLAQRGLPTSSQSAVNIYSNRLDLTNTASANVILIGVRNSVSITLFRSRTEAAPGVGDNSTQVVAPADVSETGATVNWSFRVSPVSAFVATADLTKSRGLGLDSALRSTQQTYRLEYTQTLTPATTGTLGLRRRLYDSTTAVGGNEFGAFVGMAHRL
jgi:uncharacterized protein (PEP-CTERM system associated)